MKSTGGILFVCLIFAASVDSVAIKKEGQGSQLGSAYPTTENYPTTQKPEPSPTTKSPTTYHPDPTTYEPYTKTTHKPPEDVSCYFHTIYKEGENIITEGEENIHETPEECETSCYVS